MSIQRNLQKCMEDWKQISGLDFCLLSEDNSVLSLPVKEGFLLPASWRISEMEMRCALPMPPVVFIRL